MKTPEITKPGGKSKDWSKSLVFVDGLKSGNWSNSSSFVRKETWVCHPCPPCLQGSHQTCNASIWERWRWVHIFNLKWLFTLFHRRPTGERTWFIKVRVILISFSFAKNLPWRHFSSYLTKSFKNLGMILLTLPLEHSRKYFPTTIPNNHPLTMHLPWPWFHWLVLGPVSRFIVLISIDDRPAGRG